LPENELTDFIANGDIIEIVASESTRRFTGSGLPMPGQVHRLQGLEIEVKLLLDTIYSETASL
jgi:hypothetical protein